MLGGWVHGAMVGLGILVILVPWISRSMCWAAVTNRCPLLLTRLQPAQPSTHLLTTRLLRICQPVASPFAPCILLVAAQSAHQVHHCTPFAATHMAGPKRKAQKQAIVEDSASDAESSESSKEMPQKAKGAKQQKTAPQKVTKAGPDWSTGEHGGTMGQPCLA